MAPSLGPRKRGRSNLIYRNNRLLIGWRTSKILQAETISETLDPTEAWLGQINAEEVAGDHHSNHLAAIGLLRVYVSSDGPDQMYRDVMGVDEPHPAILDPHVDTTAVAPFLDRGAIGRLKFVNRKFTSVRKGEREYCEREGGELKLFGRNAPGVADIEAEEDGSEDDETEDGKSDKDEIEGDETEESETEDVKTKEREIPELAEKKAEKKEKRKRASASSPRLDVGGAKRRRSEPEVACEEKIDHDDNDDDEDKIPPKNEEPACPGLTPEQVGVHQSTIGKDDSIRTVSSSLESLSMTYVLVDDEKKADQQKHTAPMSPMQLATQLGADVSQQAWEWARPAIRRSINLTVFTKRLATADSVSGKLEMCGKVLEGMQEYRGKFTRDRKAFQVVLESVRYKLLPENVIAAHKHLVEEYEKAEVLMADTIRLLEERARAIADKEV